jgi:hypothetical protein
MLALLLACAAAQIKLPPALAGAAPLAVGHARGGVQLGSWIAEPLGGSLHRETRPGPDAGPPTRSSKYRFALAGPDVSRQEVSCVAQLRVQVDADAGVRVVDVEARALTCTAVAWTVELRAKGRTFTGGVHLGPRELSLDAVTVLADGSVSIEPRGWIVSDVGGAYGAVETMNAGRAWLAPALDPSFEAAIAGALAAVMLGEKEWGRMVGGG